jgi:alkanesulfonate monooxygenase SsuD/methylene tetrahydromethanopterin reductase-like flavin-dependent oxidoreductase (luciferase family)
MLTFSLSLENRLAALDPTVGFEKMLRLAELADDAPFEVVWVNDSMVDTPGYEPLVALGAVAARTSRVRIGTGILQPHFRNRVILALAWATLDHAARGRTILGLGIGGGLPDHLRRECEEVGIEPRERGKLLERTVQDLRALWSDTHPDFTLPIRPWQEHVPIWLAAGIYHPQDPLAGAQAAVSNATRGRYVARRLDRVARLADGWFTLMATPDEIARAHAHLAEEATKVGRDVRDITPCLELWVNVGKDSARAYREVQAAVRRYFGGAPIPDEVIRRWSIWGSVDSCEERLAAFDAAGIRHVKLVLASSDPLTQFDLVVDRLLPRHVAATTPPSEPTPGGGE